MAGGEPTHPRPLHPHLRVVGDMVEIWFGIIERQAIHRGSFPTVRDLMVNIRDFLTGWNRRKHPFIWTKPADEILDKIDRKRRHDSTTRD